MRRTFRAHLVTVTSIIGLATLLFVLQASSTSAQTRGSEDDTKTQSSYIFKAETGDSLTVFVRSAIDSFLKAEDGTLSPAKRVFAETQIVQNMGSPLLEVGQEVAVSRNAVDSAVKEANDLTTSQEASWQPYAGVIDFSATSLKQTAESAKDVDDKSDSKDESESKNQKDAKDSNSSETADENANWYANPLTWILIIAGVVIVWSLIVSRNETIKTNKK